MQHSVQDCRSEHRVVIREIILLIILLRTVGSVPTVHAEDLIDTNARLDNVAVNGIGAEPARTTVVTAARRHSELVRQLRAYHLEAN